MIDKLLFVPGWVDPSLRVQNIPILKNGTNYIRENVEKWGWLEKSISTSNIKISRFAILRDPYERWLSGFAEDLESHFFYSNRSNFDLDDYNFDKDVIKKHLWDDNNSYWFFDFLIDKDITKFDAHANLQYNSLKEKIESIGLEYFTFIKMTDRLGDALNYWLGTKKIISHFTNAKINQKNSSNSIIKKRILEYFSNPRNANRKDRVLDYLTPDYEFINSIKFVNDN